MSKEWKSQMGTYLGNIWGHDNIISAIQADLEAGRRKNYLFHGPAGTGKTSTAKAIGAFYDGEMLDLNGSDDTGIDVVRGKIKSRAGRATITGCPQIIFVDEFEMMTNNAQSALKRVVEDYENNCIFIFCTNHLNKVIEPIRSRCEGSTYYFGPLGREEFEMLITDLSETTGVSFTPEQIEQLYIRSRGIPRNAVAIAQTMADGTDVGDPEVSGRYFVGHLIAGETDLYKVLKHTSHQDIPEILDIVIADFKPETARKMIKLIGDAEFRMQNTHNKDLHMMNLYLNMLEVLDDAS